MPPRAPGRAREPAAPEARRQELSGGGPSGGGRAWGWSGGGGAGAGGGAVTQPAEEHPGAETAVQELIQAAELAAATQVDRLRGRTPCGRGLHARREAAHAAARATRPMGRGSKEHKTAWTPRRRARPAWRPIGGAPLGTGLPGCIVRRCPPRRPKGKVSAGPGLEAVQVPIGSRRPSALGVSVGGGQVARARSGRLGSTGSEAAETDGVGGADARPKPEPS